MIRILAAIIIFIAFLCGCMTAHKNNISLVNIESLTVYKDFKERGYSTAGAFTHFEDMERNNRMKVSISDKEIRRLEEIMNGSRQKRHFQRKLAGGLIFLEVQFVGKNSESRVLIGLDSEISIIMNLSSKKDYIIENSSDIKWLSEFTKRLKSDYLQTK